MMRSVCSAPAESSFICVVQCECKILPIGKDGPFEWNEPTQGLILGSYFWGYIVSQLPAGRMAEKFGAKWVLFVSALLNIIVCLLIPTFSHIHYSVLMTLRIVQGIAGGFAVPAMHVMISKWIPPQERSILSAIIYAGMSLGTMLSLLMTGTISAALNWEATFYITGSLPMVWCVLWAWIVADCPESSRFISDEERNYITESLGGTWTREHSSFPVPWLKIFTSLPFLAILLAHFCNNFGWYMLFIELPKYLSTILKFNIKANALLSSLPFLTMWVFGLVVSKCVDVAREREYVSTTAARKIATGIASVVPCLCLVAVGLVGCNRAASVALFTIAAMSLGATPAGFFSNHIDIAPNFAGTLVGITNTIATIPGFVVPAMVGHLTRRNQTIYQWRIMFLITAGLFLVEAVFYTLLASGEVQPWNQPAAVGGAEETTATRNKSEPRDEQAARSESV